MHSILIAGVQSGCGKTTITLALMQHLIALGVDVQGFKSGPDFLDPLWHKKLSGKNSYNLDTKMVGITESRRLLLSQQNFCDIALIEGVMGLFDGRSGVGLDGSSAHLAKSLNIDVILIIDAKGLSGSVVPLVFGFVSYAKEMGLNISGIIANRVGSQHHANLIKQLLAESDLPPLLAWMDKNAPTLAERHLGLVQPDKQKAPDFHPYFHLEVDDFLGFIHQCKTISPVDNNPDLSQQLLANKNISIAYDSACCFIYPANIDWLKYQGANIHYFSPLAGDIIAENTDAIWLPGGYPELYAEQLSQSATLASLKQFIASGKPLLAECGGMMILGETLVDQQHSWSMAGILPIITTMQSKLASLGYRECINGINKGVKGHEFHHSTRSELSNIETAFPVSRGDAGIQQGNIRASYIHWYFPSASKVVAKWFGQ